MWTPGIIALIAAYGLSQFYRACLAVLSGPMATDLGATEAALSDALGYWFLAFALMQIPVGMALDRFGPRRTAAGMLFLGGSGGAILMAMAQSATQVQIAMGIIGIGCAPVLMASFYIFAREYTPKVFATYAGATIALGSLGNVAASIPLSTLADALGWRTTMVGLGLITALVSGAILAFVKDPERTEQSGQGSVLDLLKIPALWLILPMLAVNYGPSASIRGLWAGPYGSDIAGASQSQIGLMTLAMGLAMIAGNFAYGPLDRIFGTRKWVVIVGNALAALTLAALWMFPAPGLIQASLAFMAIGFFGSSFPILMAHGRSFFPPHLVGAGVTLLNLFGIAGVSFAQIVSGRLFEGAGGGVAGFQSVFGFFALITAVGIAVYMLSQDRVD